MNNFKFKKVTCLKVLFLSAPCMVKLWSDASNDWKALSLSLLFYHSGEPMIDFCLKVAKIELVILNVEKLNLW